MLLRLIDNLVLVYSVPDICESYLNIV